MELMTYNLSREGYQVAGVASGEKALLKVGAEQPDLILLDLMLPGIDGMEVCRQLKGEAHTRLIPVIIVTAKGEEADIIKGLELGADDYITKPFSINVLIARVKSVLKRRKRSPLPARESNAHHRVDEQPVQVHNLILDPKRHKVMLDDKPLDLTPTEFRILYHFALHPGWVFTRYQIVEAVKGSDYYVADRSIDVLIFGLRKKLSPYSEYIETVHGVGYRFREAKDIPG
jgi:two-component system phosphate regulon response regulator PhoB